MVTLHLTLFLALIVSTHGFVTPYGRRCQVVPRLQPQTKNVKLMMPLALNPSRTVTSSRRYLSSTPANTNENEMQDNNLVVDTTATTDETKSWFAKLRSYLTPSNNKDGLTFRQRLAKMGLAAVLSYGWVSNMSYCVSVSLAWYIFSKQSGLSPLYPGQWKKFLAVYAGFWVFNNIIRPARLAVAVAVSPQFDKIVNNMQERWGVSRGAAIGITVVIANLIGTTSLMCAGIVVASVAAGVPIFPPKVV